MDEEINNYFEFADFRFEGKSGKLSRGGELILLSPKSSELLTMLLERGGQFSSKEELFDRVWPDTFVEDGVLTQNIYTLRKALGKDSDGKHLIENKTRLGYRITVPVRFVGPSFNSDSGGRPAVTRPKVRIRKFVMVAIGVALVALAALFAYRTLFSDLTISSSRIEKIRFKKLTDTGNISNPTISADGNLVAFKRSDGVFVKDVTTAIETKLEIPNVQRFGKMQFAPDGQSIYLRNRASFSLPSDLLRVSRFGGEATKVAENVWGGFSITRDGRQIAFTRVVPTENRHAVVIKDLETGAESELLSVTVPDQIRLRSDPSWSADLQKLAVIIEQPNSGFDRILVINVKSKKSDKILLKTFKQVESVIWNPDGDRMLLSASEAKFYQLWDYKISTKSLSRLTNDWNNYLSLSVSADHKKLLTTQYVFFTNIWSFEKDDLAVEKQLTFGISNRDGYFGIDDLPDGSFVYNTNEGESGDGNLWRFDPVSKEKRQLTQNAGRRNMDPAATPDGRHIYFVSDRNGDSAIWQIESDGNNPKQITSAANASDNFPQISPDGNSLYFIRKSRESSAVIQKSLADGREQVITDAEKLTPATFLSLSPDGKYLAFHHLTEKIRADDPNQNFQVALIELGNPESVRFFSLGGRLPRVFWLSDSKGFEIILPNAEADEIRRYDLAGDGPPKTVRVFPKELIFSIVRSSKDNTILLARGREQNDAVLLTNFE